MKTTLLLTLAVLLCGSVVIAQETKQETQKQEKKQEDPSSNLVQFQMAILKRGPNWPQNGAHNAELQQKHIAYVKSMLESGKLALAGGIRDNNELVAVFIYSTKSAEEAQTWLAGDPGVAAGHVVAEWHPWWSEDVMKKVTNVEPNFTTAYLAFLTRGEKWTPERTPATEAIQKGHMANIQRLADEKKLVVAGPFGDNGRLRGIFIFKVNSLEEARALAATDPAVQAGRLALEIHPLMVPQGILP